MTNQNHAAHDLGTSSGGRAYIVEYFATQLRRHDFTQYINDRLAADFACVLARHLSKLRAEGVQAGDERAAFETKFTVPVHCQWIGSGYAATEYHAWDAHKHKSRWEGWQARAALASAPVAPAEWRQELSRRVCENLAAADNQDISREDYPARILDVFDGLHAPVAGEAIIGYVVPIYLELPRRGVPVNGKVQHSPVGSATAPLYAAPQASEAVRILFPAHLRKMWSGGEVEAWLDEHQDITPPKASAKGSLERYRK